MARHMLAGHGMMPTVGFLVVLAAAWAGSGGDAFAQQIAAGTTTTSTDTQTTEQVGENLVVIEPTRGTAVTKLRKGERLAPAAVPELDPNAAGLALALLVGGALLSVDRRRQLQG